MKLWPRIYCVYLSVHMCVLDQIIYLELSENQQVRHSKQTSSLLLNDWVFVYELKWFEFGCNSSPLHEKCPNTKFLWSVFCRIWAGFGKIRAWKNSIFRHFSRSGHYCRKGLIYICIEYVQLTLGLKNCKQTNKKKQFQINIK